MDPMIQKVLGDPSKYPRELDSWLSRRFSGNRDLQVGPSQLETVPDVISTRVNVQDFGARGDGVRDDTVPIQRAIAAWILTSYDLFGSVPQTKSVLHFPAGRYKITSPLLITYLHNSVQSKLIEGYGAILEPTFSSGHVLDITVSAGVTRNLTIAGLHIDGTNLADTTNALIRLNGGTTGLYRCVVRDVALEACQGDGLFIQGYSFEHQIISPRFEGKAGNVTGSGVHINNAGLSTGVSSIDIYGGTISGFLHNVLADSPQGGCKIYGGSFLQAYNEAIYFGNSTEGAVFGSHIENAWAGGVASPSWTTSQAGIFASGRITISGVTGLGNSMKMRYVARVLANPVAVIIGGMVLANCEYYLRAEGVAGSNIAVVGTGKGSSGVVHNAMNSAARLVQIGVDGGAPFATLIGSGAGASQYVGSGSPNGVVTATVGSTYIDTAGGASSTFYVKESGSGNTGWVAYGAPGGGGAVSSVFGRTGAVVAASGDYTAAQVTNAPDLSSASIQAFSGPVTAPQLATTLASTSVVTGAINVSASNVLRVTATDGSTVTNLTPGTTSGRFLFLRNATSAITFNTGGGTGGISVGFTLQNAGAAVLFYDSTSALWIPVAILASATGGLPNVSSVFGRIGAVVATAGDYLASQVTNAADKISTTLQSFAAGIASTHASQGIGYATGSGGTVTQATSKSTGVTLSKVNGQIVMNAAALAANTSVTFVLTNTTIAATDVVNICVAGGFTNYRVDNPIVAAAGGSCTIRLTNVSAGSLSEAVKLNFAVIKAVTA